MERLVPKLPPELTDGIIHNLSNDGRSLKNCSLVCRDWVPATRVHLFHTVNILPESSFRDLVENLNSPNSTISVYVRQIIFSSTRRPPYVPFPNSEYLTDVESIEIRNVHWGILIQSSNLPPFSTFPRLKELVLTGIYLPTQCQLKDITGYLPTLECLRVDILYAGDYVSSSHEHERLQRYLPSLRVLDLVSFEGHLLSWFTPSPSIDTLILGVDMAEYGAYISCFGPALKHLVLKQAIPAELGDLDLSRNTELLTLELDFCLISGPDLTTIMQQLVTSKIEEVLIRVVSPDPHRLLGWRGLDELDKLFVPPHFPSLEKLEFSILGPFEKAFCQFIEERLVNCDTRGLLQLKEYTGY